MIEEAIAKIERAIYFLNLDSKPNYGAILNLENALKILKGKKSI